MTVLLFQHCRQEEVTVHVHHTVFVAATTLRLPGPIDMVTFPEEDPEEPSDTYPSDDEENVHP